MTLALRTTVALRTPDHANLVADLAAEQRPPFDPAPDGDRLPDEGRVAPGATRARLGLPRADWELGELGRRAELENGRITASEIDAAPHYWALGRVLRLAKRGVKHGDWRHWLKAHGIESTTAFRARRLADAFATLEELEGLSLTEALKRARARSEPQCPTAQESKRRARRRLKAMANALLKLQDDVKTPEDRSGLLPSLDQIQKALAALYRAWN